MKDIPDRIWIKFISRIKEVKEILDSSPKIVIGVSGGPDSIFLLYLFIKYSLKHKITLFPVYVNHRVRNETEIKKDIKVVEDLVKKYGLKLITRSLPRNIPKNENTLRNYRYKIFTKIAEKYNCSLIATGHTKDDFVETVLLNFFRGSGVKGLSGIPFLRTVSSEKKIYVFRPIIDISKKEILDVLENNKISFSIDKTNLEML